MHDNKITDLSICIVSWNVCETLKKCLYSIFSHVEGLSIEVIVFDNASSDNTVVMVENNFPHVKLINNNVNIGFGRGNNVAIKQCKGKYILLLNPDIVINEPVFAKMVESLKTLPEAGVVGCKLKNGDGSIQKSFHQAFPTPMSELIWGLMLDKLSKATNLHTTQSADTIEVAWIAGACMLFKSDALLTLGGFDEQYFMYGEDVDLCYRLRKMGLKAYYLPKVEMLHYHGSSSGKQSRRYYSSVMQRESVYRFMRTHYGVSSAVLYRCFWIVSGITRILLVIPPCLVSLVTFNKRLRSFWQILEKYARVVSWGLGFEKWTKKQIPVSRHESI